MRDQELGDLAPAHVRRGTQGSLPVAEPPVDGRVGQRRLSFHQLADTLHVAVRHTDGLLDHGRILARQPAGRLHSPAEAAGHAAEGNRQTAPRLERNPRRFTLIVASAVSNPEAGARRHRGSGAIVSGSKVLGVLQLSRETRRRVALDHVAADGLGEPVRHDVLDVGKIRRRAGHPRHPEVRVVVEADQVHHQPDSRVVILDLPDDEVPLGFPAARPRDCDGRAARGESVLPMTPTRWIPRAVAAPPRCPTPSRRGGRTPGVRSRCRTRKPQRPGEAGRCVPRPSSRRRRSSGHRAVGAPPRPAAERPRITGASERRGCHCRPGRLPKRLRPRSGHLLSAAAGGTSSA